MPSTTIEGLTPWEEQRITDVLDAFQQYRQHTRCPGETRCAQETEADALTAELARFQRLYHLESGEHIKRVSFRTEMHGRLLGWDAAAVASARRGAEMHDLGKLGVTLSVLNKPGALTEAEWEIMRRHPEYGAEILSRLGCFSPADLEIVLFHHERFDGTGYPRGLQGDQIPLAARLFSVIDVFDSMRWPRCYRPDAIPAEEVCTHLAAQAGRHFDPEIVRFFLDTREWLLELGSDLTPFSEAAHSGAPITHLSSQTAPLQEPDTVQEVPNLLPIHTAEGQAARAERASGKAGTVPGR